MSDKNSLEVIDLFRIFQNPNSPYLDFESEYKVNSLSHYNFLSYWFI